MRSWQARVFGVGVAGLVLGGGLLLGAPEAVADGPTNPRKLDAPPSLSNGPGELPLGDSLQLWGRPSRLSIFWTGDSVDKVVKTYSDAWTDAGFVPTVQKVDKVTSVNVLDKTSGFMRSATIIDHGDERIVIPGIMDIRVAPDVHPTNAPVPIPENAVGYMSQVADDVTSVSYNGSFAVPIPSSRLMDFYELELGKLGYKPKDEAKKHKEGIAREWERGAEWISVAAQDEELPAKNGKPAELNSMVMVTHVRALATPPGWKP